jgi:hypothetical protein
MLTNTEKREERERMRILFWKEKEAIVRVFNIG